VAIARDHQSIDFRRETLKKRYVVALATVGVLAVIVTALFILVVQTNTGPARNALLARYFRAVAARDAVTIEDITAHDFSSDLPVTVLRAGRYELYDFGQSSAGTAVSQRFMLVVDADDEEGTKQAYLAEMKSVRKTLNTYIQSIKLQAEGSSIKP
jgi:hypothetical protein